MSADTTDGSAGSSTRPLPRPPSGGLAASRRISWGQQRRQSTSISLDEEDRRAQLQLQLDLARLQLDEAEKAETTSYAPPSQSTPSSPARRHRELTLAALTGGGGGSGPRLSVNTSPSYPSFHRKSSGDSFGSHQSIPEHASTSASSYAVTSPPRSANPLPSTQTYDDLPTPKRPVRPTHSSSGPSTILSEDSAGLVKLPAGLRLPVEPTDDTPSTRVQVHSLNRRLNGLRPHVKAVKHAAEEVGQLLDSLAEAEQRLASEMSQLGDLLEDGVVQRPGGLRRLWAEDGVVGRQMRERKEERASLERSVVEPLRAWGDALKEAERDRLGKKGAGFEEEIKSFQQYTQRYLSTPSSRDSPKVDAAYEKRMRDSDILRFQIQSHLLDLTFGPRFTSLYANLLTFPSLLLNQQSVPPNPVVKSELETSLEAAIALNNAVQDWPLQRMRQERDIIDSATLNGSAVTEEDWESVDGSAGGTLLDAQSGHHVHGGERKRDRLGSKLRAAVGNLTSSVSGNRSPGNSPLNHPPATFASTSQGLPQPPRKERHSIQVLPKSNSVWGLSSGGNNASSTKGIRDLDPTWLSMKESEGRKKAGWLWCGGDKKNSTWDRCWCEVKQSHLVEIRSNADGTESEVSTDLMFASARETRKSDRRFVFEVITSKSTRRYQATSDQEMNRWLAALGNAIEASITGTASIRGTSGSNSPSISSLISVDDLGLRKSSGSSNPGVGIGLGFPSPIEKDSPSGGFPGLRGWGNDLSRKVSLKSRGRGGRPVSHQPSPSESATPMFFDPVHDIRGPPLQHPAPPNKKAHHRSKSFLPTSSMGGPTLNFISPSPVHTSTHFSVPEHLLPPLDSQTRLSFESSSSDRPSNRPSGSSGSGFLRDDFDHHIDRFVTELAASSSPDLSLASPLEAYDRRTASEGSIRDATPRPARPTTIREIAQRPENSSCVDCRRPHPKWATISLNGESVVGFMCIECSGVHRSLGSHVSKVRSVDLDNWKESDIIVASGTGNAYINSIWEERPPRADERSKFGFHLPKEFIPRKYIQELWRS